MNFLQNLIYENDFNTKKNSNFYSTRIPSSSGLLFLIKSHLISYPTPANLSYGGNFGSLAGFCLFIQIVSGIFLSMHYNADVDQAFASVEHIMRDVQNGGFMRYLHANGASAFFGVVYLHILKGLLYRSYKFVNFRIGLSGIVIFIAMMATAFVGYVLPWGQMSFWAATVITNFFSVVPFVGTELVQWLWGGFAVSKPTLSRFFSIHYFMPFVIVALVFFHFYFLHAEGSSNPFTLEYRDTNSFYLPLYPYFMVKDLLGALVFCLVLSFFIFFEPNLLGHPDNYIEANSIVTPKHIVPEWYFLPFYAILRSIPDKTLGILTMGISLVGLAFLSLDSFFFGKNKYFFVGPATGDDGQASFYGNLLHNFYVILFACNFVLLGFIGARPVEEPYLTAGFVLTCSYFILLELIILSALSLNLFRKKKF